MKSNFKKLVALLMTALMIISLAALIPPKKAEAATPKLVAFTFDDGPYSYTSGLLDGLKKRGAHVTFFMVGASGSCGVSHWESLLPRMVEEGHQIANHTWSHVAPFGNLSPTRMKNEIDNVYPYLRRAMGGDFKQLVRIPGGDMSARTSAPVNHPMIRFDFDTKDYLTYDANKVYNSIISQVKDGSIVCLHDRVGTSCTAALMAIDYLQARGYECVTVSELFRRRGITLEAYKTYNSAYNKGINLPAYKAPDITVTYSDFDVRTVKVSTTDSGITLRYTTNGSTPNLSSPVWSGTKKVTEDMTITVAGFDVYGTRTPVVTKTIKKGYSRFIFDKDYYLERNPDLRTSVGTDYDALYNHFINNGLAEGRISSPVFNVKDYRELNPDLDKAFKDDLTKYLDHFENNGIEEGRIASMDFSVGYYKEKYPDLAAAFKDDYKSYFEHYITTGRKEGRTAPAIQDFSGTFTLIP